ncbi:MAG: chorismate-binding protein [Weeksellaceae bacterium]|nr:chorismate-binding protein [Weeksellaceae bacterium]
MDIEGLLKSHDSWVFFRKPGENGINLWLGGEGKPEGERFVFTDFSGKRLHSIFPTEKFLVENAADLQQVDLGDLPLRPFADKVYEKEEYLEICKGFLQAIEKTAVQKAILSRIALFATVEAPIRHYAMLTEVYKDAFVYLLKFGNELWLGATPELLVEWEKGVLKTMALAATRKAGFEGEWTAKERDEHQWVLDYIVEKLDRYDVHVGETETVQIRQLEHLRTPIAAHNVPADDLAGIVEALHPTPAICGIPMREAYDLIMQLEKHNRGLYTGYLGVVTDDQTAFYVNLRCASLHSNYTAAYVGGGITQGSEPLKEWEETILKSKSLLLERDANKDVE